MFSTLQPPIVWLASSGSPSVSLLPRSSGAATSQSSAKAIFATVFMVMFDFGPSILHSDGWATPIFSESSLSVMPASSSRCETCDENCAERS